MKTVNMGKVFVQWASWSGTSMFAMYPTVFSSDWISIYGWNIEIGGLAVYVAVGTRSR